MEQTTTERTAAAVRAELARRNIKAIDFARDLKWPRTTAWRRLNGQVPFKLDELVAVADYLGVPIGTLLADRQAA